MDSNSSSSISSSFSSSSSSSSPSNNNNNNRLPHQNSKPIMERSNSKNRHSTIYVNADISSFKQIVQNLTGSTDTTNYGSFEGITPNSENNIPPIQCGNGVLNPNSSANTSTPKDDEPRLLPLFPTSPQASDGFSST